MTDTMRKKLGALPHKPGIYLMKDQFGTVFTSASRAMSPSRAASANSQLREALEWAKLRWSANRRWLA